MWLTFLGCFIGVILVNIYFVENAISTSLILYLANGLLLWIYCAQYIKRLHDLDRSETDIFLLILGHYSKGIDEVNKHGTSPNKSFEEQVYKSDDEYKIY